MRAKDEYKYLAESYNKVQEEGFRDLLRSKKKAPAAPQEPEAQPPAVAEEIPPMQKFGNVQFQHKGKNENNADAFEVYKDGQYVLYATLFGDNIKQRRTFSLFADPQADGQDVPNPNQPLMELDQIQTSGDFEELAKIVNEPSLHPRVAGNQRRAGEASEQAPQKESIMRAKDEFALMCESYNKVLNEEAGWVADKRRRDEEKMARQSKSHSSQAYDEKGGIKTWEPGEGQSMEEKVAMLMKRYVGPPGEPGGLTAQDWEVWWQMPMRWIVADYFARKGQAPPPADKDVLQWYNKLAAGLNKKYPKPEGEIMFQHDDITSLEDVAALEEVPN